MSYPDSSKNDEMQELDLTAFSSNSVKKAVRDESFFHPLTLYPTALGMLTGMAALLYELPALFLGMGGLLAIGATTSIVNYFFRDETISMKYLEKATKQIKLQQQQMLKNLGNDLQQCLHIEDAEKYGAQGLEQFEKIEVKYQKFTFLLKKKFKSTELTYGSYLGAAEQLHLSMLDNLIKIVSLLQGVASIDPAYIAQRKTELSSLKKITDADKREFDALNKRSELRNNQLETVNTLLTENEESMTIMDSTIAAIANLETNRKLAENDLKTAMEYLQEIAQRTSHYEKK